MPSSSNSGYRQLAVNLTGVIFGCTVDTFDECVTDGVFGLPSNHWSYVKNIKPGIAIFLFNYTTREMHGVYQATSKGEQNIKPHGWTGGNTVATNYPSQVRVEIFKQGKALKEHQFKVAIKGNYKKNSIFQFELDLNQVAHLCGLFCSAIPGKGPMIFKTEKKSAAEAQGELNKQSKRQQKLPMRVFRSHLEQDGLICGPQRPRTVGEASGLFIKKKSIVLNTPPLETKPVSMKPIERPKFDGYDALLRRIMEKRDQEAEQIQGIVHAKQDVLYLFGGIDTNQYFHKGQYYFNNSWRDSLFLPTPEFLNGHALTIGRNIYILGGPTDNRASSVELLREESKVWIPVTSMIKSRSAFGATALSEKIVIAGGTARNGDLNSAEIYDIHQNIWNLAPFLSLGISESALSSHNNVVYLTGGSSSNISSSFVSQLDLRTNKWQELPKMNRRRKNHTTVIFNDQLWVIGGQSSHNHYLKSVEVYDPRNKTWQNGSSLLYPSAYLTAEIIDDELFAIGGLSDSENWQVHGILKYDPPSETWKESLPAGSSGMRAHHASCVMAKSR